MSYLPKEPQDPKKPTSARLLLWIGVAGVAVYSIIQGIIGISHNG